MFFINQIIKTNITGIRICKSSKEFFQLICLKSKTKKNNNKQSPAAIRDLRTKESFIAKFLFKLMNINLMRNEKMKNTRKLVLDYRAVFLCSPYLLNIKKT